MAADPIIRCVTIDDEPHALALLRTFISGYSGLKLVEEFNDAIEGLAYLKSNPVDLLFIDINMPDITGLDLVKQLSPMPMVIFTTAHKKFALEGFELEAIDYLLKPISPDRFAKAIRRATEFFSFRSGIAAGHAEPLFVYSEYRMIKIELSSILYIESLEDYIRIHLADEKPVLTLMTLKKVLEKLPENNFRRIHRSFIVSTNKVKAIHNRKVTLDNGIELPLSDSYLDFIQFWKSKS